MEPPRRNHIVAQLVGLSMCLTAYCVKADDATNSLKLDGTLINVVHAPDGSWIHAGEKVHIYSIDAKENTAQIDYKGTNITIPKYGLNQQDVAFFLKYNRQADSNKSSPIIEITSNPTVAPNREYSHETNTTAPIIESGRLVGLITNTSASLTETLSIPTFSDIKKTPPGTIETAVTGFKEIGTNSEHPTIHLLKVEDDIATILPDQNGILPKVEIPVSLVSELKGLPHLGDSNSLWISTRDVMKSLLPARRYFLWKYQPTTPEESACGKWHDNDINIFWYHRPVENEEYLDLKVPITTERPEGDSSAVVAVANALSYLNTKADSKPTQVSKAYLTWAHDAFAINESELAGWTWQPSAGIHPDKLQEGARFATTLHPERLDIPVTSGREHEVDLGRLLHAVQRFGVALESEWPSDKEWKSPSAEIITTARGHRPIVVRCFHAWNDPSPRHKVGDNDFTSLWLFYDALFFPFVTKEIKEGRPVIITKVRKLGNDYYKRTFVITGTGNPEGHQSLEYLTPSGVLETYKSNGRRDTIFGEVINRDDDSFGAFHRGKAYISLFPSSNLMTLPGVTYQNKTAPKNRRCETKFEIYSVGFN